MKKQKLHHITRIATFSLLSAMTVLGTSEASAQQSKADSRMMPPIVSGSSQRSEAPNAMLLAPSSSRPSRTNVITPPIISGATVDRVGSGIVEQVSGTLEPLKQPAVAKAFSPTKMPMLKQGSGTRNAIAPAIQIPSPMPRNDQSIIAPPAIGDFQNSLPPSAPVISGSLVSPETSGGQISVSPNYFDSNPIVDPIPMTNIAGDCSTGTCGSCNSCGDGGCYDPKRINCDYGTYGSVSAARRYAYFEALYMTREDGDITNSNFNPLGEFDFGLGWRFTVGQRPDMTQGREISYFGTADIENRQVTDDSRNRLDPLFRPAGGIESGDLSSFFDANRHVQFKETNIHSIELNRVRWGWDVLKSFVGWRYVFMDDQYQLDSTAPNRDIFGNVAPGFETGRYRIDTVNHLLGAHIGAELFYDIGYRFSLSGISKFGAYANINKVDNFLQSDGTILLDTEDNGANISTTYELGLLAHYQLRQTARVRLGYNAMFLGRVATVSDNFSPFVSPFTGFNSSDEDDAFLHGFSFGLEIYR